MRLRQLIMLCLSIVCLSAAALLPGPVAAQGASAGSVTVFAAASLREALDDFNAQFSAATGIKTAVSYAATSALARQIESGAPADVFISADLTWMDYAVAHRLVDGATRVNLLGNALVLIAPNDSKLKDIAIAKGFDVTALAGDGRIAVADIKAVPAGRYAKAALEALGALPAAEPKLAQAENVRAALSFVARGETPVGIVYATDAKSEPGVKVIGVFPEDSHPPVTYPAAATATATPAAARYLQMLRSPAAKATFERYGFSYLIKPVS